MVPLCTRVFLQSHASDQLLGTYSSSEPKGSDSFGSLFLEKRKKATYDSFGSHDRLDKYALSNNITLVALAFMRSTTH